ncbi:phytanoyl-CoA dioxygenase family protein [Lentithecium fluviatile CBS 122367]|uniref:Phytanoyl-CoA dioxygenase family protein n=1 Tax=Lentithecium fluviatile CBS 122367 TaxID=1168545 RepID=A0A6G1IIH1_9PLEO|nr:phytanoyl-CoA dioxygenase family protein [Lentithecium fluviatile CBS 122367]
METIEGAQLSSRLAWLHRARVGGMNDAGSTTTAATPLRDTAPNPYKAARELLDRDGFVVLPATLFPSFDLTRLRTAATRLTTAARAGSWPYIRTLPKQFPPWPSDPSNGIWGVQHLLHPTNPDHLVFAKSYFDAELMKYVAALIGCSEDDLVMELYNMLVRPDKAFSLRWHRDDIPASASDDEEMKVLGRPGLHAQWNLALFDDASLVVVPGSHKRARTSVERAADPYAPELPGQLVVKLKAGEVAFYNNNILHRGVYDPEKERMTLHGSMGTTLGSGERARNVLQHGVGEWVGQYDFKEFEPEMAERAGRMRDRLVEMGERCGDVGFFSKDE